MCNLLSSVLSLTSILDGEGEEPEARCDPWNQLTGTNESGSTSGSLHNLLLLYMIWLELCHVLSFLLFSDAIELYSEIFYLRMLILPE